MFPFDDIIMDTIICHEYQQNSQKPLYLARYINASASCLRIANNATTNNFVSKPNRQDWQATWGFHTLVEELAFYN